MHSFKNQKKKIDLILNNRDFDYLIKEKIIEDIYIYGSQNDKFSDLDLFFVVDVSNITKKKNKILKYLKKYKAIIVPSHVKNLIFFFFIFQIFSFKKKMNIKNITIGKPYYRRILLYSFFDRYYERSITIKKNKLKKFSFGNVRILKSFFFSFHILSLIFTENKPLQNKIRKILEKYLQLRRSINHNYLNYKKLYKFAINSNKEIYPIIFDLIEKTSNSKFKENIFLFKSGYKFINNSKKNILKSKLTTNVPNIVNEYFYLYSFASLSFFRNIKKRFEYKPAMSKNPDSIQLKKIYFIIESIKLLKNLKYKKSLIRWVWML